NTNRRATHSSRYLQSPRRRTRARGWLSPGGPVACRDINVIDAPAFTGVGAVTSHPPAHNKLVLHDASSRKAHHSGIDKSGRVTSPRLPASQGIATATADRAVVTALNKRATGSKDVLKGQPVIVADLEYPAIKPILKVEVVAERYVHHALIA